MRRLGNLVSFFLFIFAATLASSAQTTPNLGLSLPAHGTLNWDTAVDNNFSMIDQVLGQLQASFQGNWSNSTTYAKGQTVLLGETLYQSAISANTGNTPSTSPSQWTAILTVPTANDWPGSGACNSGQYMTSLGNGSAPQCATISWGQISSAPTTLPPSGSAGGDLNGTYPFPTVERINGTKLAFLTTGLLKNTTGTGVPSIAVPGTDYQIPITVTTTGSNCGTPTFASGVLNIPPCSGGSSPLAGSGIAVSGSTVINAGNTDSNAVTKLGLDNTGAIDITSALSTFFNSGNNLSLYMPCGSYKQTAPIVVNATTSTGQSIRVYAASPDCVIINLAFTSGLQNADAWWFDNSAAGNNNYGPTIDGIVFSDTSGAGTAHSAVRITNYANVGRLNYKVTNFSGVQYQTGTVTATNGSTAVTLSGGTFPAAACPGGHLWIAGHFQEVNSCSGTSATLTIPWQYTTVSASAYSLDYNGVGLLLDGGSSFVQYNKEPLVVRAAGVRVGVDALGSPSSTSGVSRFDFGPGYINCNRVADSMAFFLGDYSDTFLISSKANNCSRFAHMENSHAALILGARFENAGTGTAAYGCTATPHTYSCNVGVEAIGNSASANARGNKVIGSYIYDTGVGITWDTLNTNFYAAGNDIETFANDVAISPPSSGNGYTTAEVHDPTLQLSPGGIVNIAPVSLAVPSFPVPGGQCYGSSGSTTPATFTFSGLTTTMGITPRYTGNISGVSGWGTGGIKLNVWPTATPGTGQYLVCNTSTSIITPTAITFSLEAK